MKDLLSYFYEISRIPRASYKEDKIARYLMDFAAARSLEAYTDEALNVLIRKPGSPGYDTAPAVLIQGHTDMVCEKTFDTVHDFDTEGIRILRDGDFLRADGTTLGADDGYAVAAMLAILDDDTLPHPPLECLFTTSEEVGLDGMRALDPAWIRARRMINLDSCDEKCATASCAGGVRTYFHREGAPEDASGTEITVRITGLMGGHSGEEIHRGRGNALKIAARLWEAALPAGVRLISVTGGTKDNAIPREAALRLLTKNAEAACAALRAAAETVYAELSDDDRAMKTDVSAAPYSGPVFADADADALRTLIRILPCGPLGMSFHLPGIVETSSNTAIVQAEAGVADVTISSRSLTESRLDDLVSILETVSALCGFTVRHMHRYPGWQFKTDSELQRIYRIASEEILGRPGDIIGIHAGLECGLMEEKIPGMDMLSIGPDMYDLHTPKERLSVSSAERVFRIVLRMLALSR